MDGWYYKLFGDEFGPVSFDGLVELAKSHTLSPDDEVRFGDNGPWRRAGSMGQLMAHMPSGSHIPSAAILNSASSKSEEPTGWYYKSFGEEFGPVPFDDLVELAKNQTLSVDDEVRFGESGPWRRAGSIGKLMAHLPFQAKKNAFTIEVKQPASDNGKNNDDDTFELSGRYGLDLATEPDPSPMILEPLSSRTPPPTKSLPTAKTPAASAPPAKPPTTYTPVPEAEDAWWCMIAGKEYGPVDLPKLVAWAASGRLHRNDHIRRGLEAYVVADELPGLFPELPTTPASAVETKSEITARAATRTIPTSNPSVDVPARPVSPAPQPETARPEPTPAAAAPAATNWQANSGATAGGFNRPAVAMPRPMPKKSSGGLDKLLVPILGVVGVCVLGGLIYLLLPFILGSPDAKNFLALRTAYNQYRSKKQDENVSKEDFKKFAADLGKAVKPIETGIKGKTPAVTSLKALGKKLQEIAKAKVDTDDDKKKLTEIEKDVDKKIAKLKKDLKVRD